MGQAEGGDEAKALMESGEDQEVNRGGDGGRAGRVGSAIFYSLSSTLIMLTNKRVLSIYKFPSFTVVGMGQMMSTIILLRAAKAFGWISFPPFGLDMANKIFPLPLFYAGNMLSGLGGTQSLSLPMLTVLRRFSILMAMVAEAVLLAVTVPLNVRLAVCFMIFGAVVAAANDMAFNLKGYTYLMLNNTFTCGINVISKKKMNENVGKYGLMYYNSLMMLAPTLLLAYLTGDLAKAWEFDGWTGNPAFTFCFLLSCVFGFILMYSSMLCVQYNSALTTAIIGALKNIFITYIGMFYGGDYTFDIWNFVGLNISALASIYYTKLTFGKKESGREKFAAKV